MKMTNPNPRFTRLVAMLLAAGATCACLAPQALAQQEGRRRRAAAESKPVEITAEQSAMLTKIANDRKLNVDDLLAAAKTYTPSGRHDDYVLFSSGGQSGQIFAIGVPSMRLLRSIAVFTPESWQGYGFAGDDDPVRKRLEINGKPVLWGDTHHPALSETAGDYDGQFLFIGDKANARLGVIDLRDWETKQIVKNPLTVSDHGAAFVTPNTDYVIEGGQYATVLGYGYAPPEEYKKSYRGMVTMWKFDRSKGRIDESQSFAIELPPDWQDLADAGKLASDGSSHSRTPIRTAHVFAGSHVAVPGSALAGRTLTASASPSTSTRKKVATRIEGSARGFAAYRVSRSVGVSPRVGSAIWCRTRNGGTASGQGPGTRGPAAGGPRVPEDRSGVGRRRPRDSSAGRVSGRPSSRRASPARARRAARPGPHGPSRRRARGRRRASRSWGRSPRDT